MRTHIILYVADQARSAAFYEATLAMQPTLDVPGMTEFALSNDTVLGLMPEAGIRRLLGDAIPDPALATGVPRAEIYLVVPSADEYHRRAVHAGARELSPAMPRSWGSIVSYCIDPDGHVLAFDRGGVGEKRASPAPLQ